VALGSSVIARSIRRLDRTGQEGLH